MANIRFNARHGLSVGSTPIDVVDSSGLVSVSSVPGLDAAKITSGIIDAARLPSFVDDVLEFANEDVFPVPGETGKIYVALDTNKVYRWSGSTYVQITSGAVDSVAGKTGIVALVKGDVGLGNADNTADSAKSVLEATRLTTARTIGGVSFNGTANINLPGVNAQGNQNTTGSAATLTTARTLTIGNTGKTFNGSANVAWSSAEIVNRTTAPADTFASWGTGVQLADTAYPAGTGSIVASFVFSSNRGLQLATSSFSENTPLQFRRVHTNQPNGLGAFQELVDNTSTQTVGGVKTFSSTITGSISGNAGTVTNGVLTVGNQTIGGIKTFSSAPAIIATPAQSYGGLLSTLLVRDSAVAAADVGGVIGFGNGTYGTGGVGAFNEGIGQGGYLSLLYRPVTGNITEGLRINSSGNVGIGTSNPANLLDVSYSSSSTNLTIGPGNDVDTGIRVHNTSTTTDAYSYVDLRTGNGDVRLAGINKGTNLSEFAILTDNGAGIVEGMRITSTQNVGIGTTTPGFKLEVNGSFAATTKSFVIPHPTKKGKKLRYGSLEGPENGIYIRGKLKDTDTIELPDYWTKLVDPDSITVTLTPIGTHQKLYVKDVCSNTVTVGNENLLDKTINCYYVVYAERCDVEKLEVEIDVS